MVKVVYIIYTNIIYNHPSINVSKLVLLEQKDIVMTSKRSCKFTEEFLASLLPLCSWYYDWLEHHRL